MKVIYDESVFRDGLIFQSIRDEKIFVSNDADKFLLERLGFKTTDVCAESNISLNPVNPCAQINVFSLAKRNAINNYMYAHSAIHVFRNNVSPNASYAVKTLDLSEPNISVIYDVNENMTAMEMALLIKYYSFSIASGAIVPTSVGQSVKISTTLYHTIHEWFKNDDRTWFSFDFSKFIMKNYIGQNTMDGVVINMPSYIPVIPSHAIV